MKSSRFALAAFFAIAIVPGCGSDSEENPANPVDAADADASSIDAKGDSRGLSEATDGRRSGDGNSGADVGNAGDHSNDTKPDANEDGGDGDAASGDESEDAATDNDA